jgi:hypothetical protein
MGTVSFQEMPMVVKVAAAVAFFTAWMCLEEFVINRSGFWSDMPYYKKDDACVWDLAVAMLIVVGLWWLSRSREELDAAPFQHIVGVSEADDLPSPAIPEVRKPGIAFG